MFANKNMNIHQRIGGPTESITNSHNSVYNSQDFDKGSVQGTFIDADESRRLSMASLHSDVRAKLLFNRRQSVAVQSNYMDNENIPAILTADLYKKSKKSRKAQTIENMPNRVTQIFERIKEQLKEKDHPLNIIINEFRKRFVSDYK